jgi:hypothetical protein
MIYSSPPAALIESSEQESISHTPTPGVRELSVAELAFVAGGSAGQSTLAAPPQYAPSVYISLD